MVQGNCRQIAEVLAASSAFPDCEFQGISTDTRSLEAGMLYLALRGERFDGHAFLEQAGRAGAVAAVVEQARESALPLIQVADTRQALTRLASWWRQQFSPPLIAITGSNGKTTVKEMLRAIFARSGRVLATEGNLNNEIGVPLTLFRLGPEHQRAVIEMGANHSGEIARLSALARPRVAVITQCAPAHLEGFGSVDGVARAKGEIFSGLVDDGIAVINRDDHYADFWSELVHTRQLRGGEFGPILDFGLDSAAAVGAGEIELLATESRFLLRSPLGEIPVSLPLPGRHNIANALAAAACALAAGADLSQISAGLGELKGVQGRLQPRPAARGVTVLDDTYNANPTSLEAALSVLAASSGPRWLALGDMLELGVEGEALHTRAGLLAREAGVERLLTLGELTRASVQAFGPGATHYPNHQALLADLRAELPAGATLLVKGSRGSRMEQIVQEVVGRE